MTTLGSPWSDRWKSPTAVDRFDVIICAPRALDDVERHIRFNVRLGRWQTRDDDGRTWQYVSFDWVCAWLLRCGYLGFLQLFQRAPREFGHPCQPVSGIHVP